MYQTLDISYRGASGWAEVRSFGDALHAVVDILSLEQKAVMAPGAGRSFVENILELHHSLVPLAGSFALDVHAASPQSLKAFCEGPVASIGRGLPPDLARACFAALSARLACLVPADWGTRELVEFSVEFLDPILREALKNPVKYPQIHA